MEPDVVGLAFELFTDYRRIEQLEHEKKRSRKKGDEIKEDASFHT
jgi:hypothetical protein